MNGDTFARYAAVATVVLILAFLRYGSRRLGLLPFIFALFSIAILTMVGFSGPDGRYNEGARYASFVGAGVALLVGLVLSIVPRLRRTLGKVYLALGLFVGPVATWAAEGGTPKRIVWFAILWFGVTVGGLVAQFQAFDKKGAGREGEVK